MLFPKTSALKWIWMGRIELIRGTDRVRIVQPESGKNSDEVGTSINPSEVDRVTGRTEAQPDPVRPLRTLPNTNAGFSCWVLSITI